MTSINKVILVGRIGKEPEIRTMQNGSKVASMTVATSDKWKDKATGEKKEKTEWHKISVFSPSAVGFIENYIKKGALVYIEGKLQTRKWQDKEGKDNYTTDILIQGYDGAVNLLSASGSKEGSREGSNELPQHYQPINSGIEDYGDDIPF